MNLKPKYSKILEKIIRYSIGPTDLHYFLIPTGLRFCSLGPLISCPLRWNYPCFVMCDLKHTQQCRQNVISGKIIVTFGLILSFFLSGIGRHARLVGRGLDIGTHYCDGIMLPGYLLGSIWPYRNNTKTSTITYDWRGSTWPRGNNNTASTITYDWRGSTWPRGDNTNTGSEWHSRYTYQYIWLR